MPAGDHYTVTALSSDDIILNFSQLSVLTPVVLPSSINIPLTTRKDVRAERVHAVAKLRCFHLAVHKHLAVATQLISWIPSCQFLWGIGSCEVLCIYNSWSHRFLWPEEIIRSSGPPFSIIKAIQLHSLTPVVNPITCVSLSSKKDIQRLQKMANPLLPWKLIPTANHPKYYTTNTGLGLIKLSPLWIRVSWLTDLHA